MAFGIELNAEAVAGLMSFIDPSAGRRRIVTTDDLVKESTKLREQARVEIATNREVDQHIDERKVESQRLVSHSQVPSGFFAASDAGSFRAHNFAGVMLR